MFLYKDKSLIKSLKNNLITIHKKTIECVSNIDYYIRYAL